MIRTKAILLREIGRLKKRKSKLTLEVKMLNDFKRATNELKKSIALITKEIDAITVRIETLYWCANTSEKSLPKVKSKKSKVKVKKGKNLITTKHDKEFKPI